MCAISAVDELLVHNPSDATKVRTFEDSKALPNGRMFLNPRTFVISFSFIEASLELALKSIQFTYSITTKSSIHGTNDGRMPLSHPFSLNHLFCLLR